MRLITPTHTALKLLATTLSSICSITELGVSTDRSLSRPLPLTSLGLWLPSVKWTQQCPSPWSNKTLLVLFDFGITVIHVSGAALLHSQMTSHSLHTATTTKQCY